MVTDKKEYYILQEKINKYAKNMPLYSPEIVNLSEALDLVILESMKCRKNNK